MDYLINNWNRNSNETFGDINYTEQEESSLVTAEDLSREMTKTVLPVTLIIAVEALFGLIGNIFILIVYYKWYKICSFRYFVLYMAFIDLTSSLTTLPGEIVSQTNWYSYPSDTLCKAKSFFNVFTVWSTGLILFLLAHDRYRKICHPLSWQIPVRTSARLCFACIMFSLIIASPTAVFWGTQNYEYNHGNYSTRVCICEKADSYANDLVPFFYVLCALVTPMFLIMLTTSLLNICTGRKLLIGLKQSDKCSQNGACGMPAVGLDDSSIQYSSIDLETDDSYQRAISKRRSSFPAGKSTLRRKLLSDTASRFQHSERKLDVIPENNNGLVYLKKHTHIELFPIRRLRFSREKFFSDSHAFAPHMSLRRLNMWQNSYLKHRLSSRRRKTLIMLILSGVFIVTMSLYLGLVCKVANTEGVLKTLTNVQKVQFFFFWRLYFINSVINPLLYGFMDQRFRKGLTRLFCNGSYYMRKYNQEVFAN